MKTSTAVVLALAATACYGLYTYSPFQKAISDINQNYDHSQSTMTDRPQPQICLEFLSHNTSIPDIPKLHFRAHITNPSSTHPISLLRWNSILDPQAGLLGQVQLYDLSTSAPTQLDVPLIKINRKTPAPKEEYIRIEAGKSVTNEVTLALTGSKVESGREYEARAEGMFMEMFWGNAEDGDMKSGVEGNDGRRYLGFANEGLVYEGESVRFSI